MTSPLAILSRTFRPIDLPTRVPKTCATCGTAVVGLYLLVSSDEIVYVGSSIDVATRLYVHVTERTRMERDNWQWGKRFDRALYLPLPGAVLPHYEGALIRALAPPANGRPPRDRGHDAEILHGLGLRDELRDAEIAADDELVA
jgi:hypothetical protein